MSEREQMERVGRGKEASYLLGRLSFAFLFCFSILISDQVKVWEDFNSHHAQNTEYAGPAVPRALPMAGLT